MIRFFIFSFVCFVPILGTSNNLHEKLEVTTPGCADLICSYDMFIDKDATKKISISLSLGKPSKIIGNFNISYNDDDLGFESIPPTVQHASVSLFEGKLEIINDVSVGGISYKLIINRGDVKVSQDDDGKFKVHWCPFVEIRAATLTGGPRFCFIYTDGFRKQFSFDYDGDSRRINKFWMGNGVNENGNRVMYYDAGKRSLQSFTGNRFSID